MVRASGQTKWVWASTILSIVINRSLFQGLPGGVFLAPLERSLSSGVINVTNTMFDKIKWFEARGNCHHLHHHTCIDI